MSKAKKIICSLIATPLIGYCGLYCYFYLTEVPLSMAKPILGALDKNNSDNKLRYQPEYLKALKRMNKNEQKNVPFADGLKTQSGLRFVIDDVKNIIFNKNSFTNDEEVKWTCEAEIGGKIYSSDTSNMQCQFFKVNLTQNELKKCSYKIQPGNNSMFLFPPDAKITTALTPFSFSYITSNQQLPKSMIFFLSGAPVYDSPQKITMKRNGVNYFNFSSTTLSRFSCNLATGESNKNNMKYGFYLAKTFTAKNASSPKEEKEPQEELFTGPRKIKKNFLCKVNWKNENCDIFYTEKPKTADWNWSDNDSIKKITKKQDITEKKDNYFVLKLLNFWVNSDEDTASTSVGSGSIVIITNKNNQWYNNAFEVISLISYAHQNDQKPELQVNTNIKKYDNLFLATIQTPTTTINNDGKKYKCKYKPTHNAQFFDTKTCAFYKTNNDIQLKNNQPVIKKFPISLKQDNVNFLNNKNQVFLEIFNYYRWSSQKSLSLEIQIIDENTDKVVANVSSIQQATWDFNTK